MLNWYKNLYVGETVKKKEEKLIRKIERGRKTPGVYVVTLASNERDQLDILSVSQMEGREKRGISPMIAGLAGAGTGRTDGGRCFSGNRRRRYPHLSDNSRKGRKVRGSDDTYHIDNFKNSRDSAADPDRADSFCCSFCSSGTAPLQRTGKKRKRQAGGKDLRFLVSSSGSFHLFLPGRKG